MDAMFAFIDLSPCKKTTHQIYDGIQIFLVIKGTLQLEVNRSPLTLKTNGFVLFNRYDVYSVTETTDNLVLLLKIPSEYVKNECSDMCLYNYRCCSNDAPLDNQFKYDKVRRILICMMLEYFHHKDGYLLSVKIYLLQLMHFLVTNFKHLSVGEKNMTDEKKDDRIQSILTYIHSNFRKNLTLESVSKQLFLSSSYISKLFKRHMGMGFWEYVNQIRLESSMKDLLCTNESILKIGSCTKPVVYIN